MGQTSMPRLYSEASWLSYFCSRKYYVDIQHAKHRTPGKLTTEMLIQGQVMIVLIRAPRKLSDAKTRNELDLRGCRGQRKEVKETHYCLGVFWGTEYFRLYGGLRDSAGSRYPGGYLVNLLNCVFPLRVRGHRGRCTQANYCTLLQQLYCTVLTCAGTR